jgi:hypothetical protein
MWAKSSHDTTRENLLVGVQNERTQWVFARLDGLICQVMKNVVLLGSYFAKDQRNHFVNG